MNLWYWAALVKKPEKAEQGKIASLKIAAYIFKQYMEFRSELILLGKLQKHNFLAFNLKSSELIFNVFSFAYSGFLLRPLV